MPLSRVPKHQEKNMDMEHTIDKVLIAGAGPVGLLCALLLGQQGIAVDVFEASSKLDNQPRALAYGPPASRQVETLYKTFILQRHSLTLYSSVLRRAGILDEVLLRGFKPRTVSWRKLNGEEITGFSGLNSVDSSVDTTVILPVGSLSALLEEETRKFPHINIYWQHKVTNVGQDDQHAWIEADRNGKMSRFSGDFLVGGDGANSAVRRILFNNRFPGYTWPRQIVSLNLYYDFEKYGWSDVQWIVDPEYWGICCKVNKKGLWRVAYPQPLGLAQEQSQEGLTEALRVRLPGSPGPDDYRIEVISSYLIHQRCAERMRVGRVVLAGDAAHLCNPQGGLGLTTGICDVGSLIDCLLGIHRGEASLDILEQYDRVRRQKFYSVTHPTSVANMARIAQPVDNVIGKDPLFALLDEAKAKPEMLQELLQHEQSIGADMTVFYNARVPDDMKAPPHQGPMPPIFEQSSGRHLAVSDLI